MRKAFTIMELLVAVGLLAVVLAAVGIIFNYSIDAQRTAASTAEMMHTLRAITDQLNIDFTGLQKDGYLVLWSDDSNSALYFFSVSQGNLFQSWHDPNISNIARIYLGPARNDPNNLAQDMLLLTPGYPSVLDYRDVSFAQCQADIVTYLEDPCAVLSTNRPDANSTNVRSLFAQRVGSFKIEWTDGTKSSNQINWFGKAIPKGGGNFENIIDQPYLAYWSPLNQSLWPKALKFTFTLYDSRGLFKNGRKFEHIVYIGQ